MTSNHSYRNELREALNSQHKFRDDVFITAVQEIDLIVNYYFSLSPIFLGLQKISLLKEKKNNNLQSFYSLYIQALPVIGIIL